MNWSQGYSGGYFPVDCLTIWSFSNAAGKLRWREIENSLFIRFRVEFEYFPSLLLDRWKYFKTLHKSRRLSFFLQKQSIAPITWCQVKWSKTRKLISAFGRQHTKYSVVCIYLWFSNFSPANVLRKATIVNGRVRHLKKTEP